MKPARVVQNRNGLIEVPILNFELCELEQSGCDRLRFYAGVAKIGKQLSSALPAPCTNFEPCEIPSRKCSSWLFRAAYPSLQLVARWFVFRWRRLVESREENRKSGVRRMTINKLLDDIVCDFRRFELHLRFRDTENCRDSRGGRRSFWSFQEPLKNADRSFRSPLD